MLQFVEHFGFPEQQRYYSSLAMQEARTYGQEDIVAFLQRQMES